MAHRGRLPQTLPLRCFSRQKTRKIAATNRHVIYRCVTAGNDHFVSTDLACEGTTAEGTLGFIE